MSKYLDYSIISKSSKRMRTDNLVLLPETASSCDILSQDEPAQSSISR